MSHHLLRDWPILKVCEKKFLQATEIAFQKRAILNFRLSGFPPCYWENSFQESGKNPAKARAYWGRGIWLHEYNHTLSKGSPYSVVLSRAQVSIPRKGLTHVQASRSSWSTPSTRTKSRFAEGKNDTRFFSDYWWPSLWRAIAVKSRYHDIMNDIMISA